MLIEHTEQLCYCVFVVLVWIWTNSRDSQGKLQIVLPLKRSCPQVAYVDYIPSHADTNCTHLLWEPGKFVSQNITCLGIYCCNCQQSPSSLIGHTIQLWWILPSGATLSFFKAAACYFRKYSWLDWYLLSCLVRVTSADMCCQEDRSL